mmetsp:Transcript_22320/g.24905  ORF Transcript_22320/g.24905 Transcript_22320/m.24905 type:complete len:122 (+) Transcript_22320:39-404(+)
MLIGCGLVVALFIIRIGVFIVLLHFPKKYDKSGEFIRHYLPVLKDIPDKYIYEPWKAPLGVQQRAKCIIGKDYPEPIVDHSVASKENKEKMKAAFASAKSSSSKRKKSTDEPPRKRRKVKK